MVVDLTFRGRRIVRDRALVMAIVNRTPDSFYDKGATFAPDAALEAVRRAIGDGADIIDIGGVRAGPGIDVDATEEARRTVPFVEVVRTEFPDAVVSIDTWRADVAAGCLAAGADIVNDTWAGHDRNILLATAEAGAGYVCSHTGGAEPRTRPHRVTYEDVVKSVVADTAALAEEALAVGVPRSGVLIDPTHDFGKNTWHGLELIRRCSELVATGWPVLMALSRKDFIGETLDLPPDERLEGTLAATALAAAAGCAVFRAHDVVATRRVLEMVASIAGKRPPARPERGLV
ncbi:MAG TPA: dihydropteroate synthase [Aeromicrobium sp.]|nr:dihydropteroate synthase [Aeromicrobium sp.]